MLAFGPVSTVRSGLSLVWVGSQELGTQCCERGLQGRRLLLLAPGPCPLPHSCGMVRAAKACLSPGHGSLRPLAYLGCRPGTLESRSTCTPRLSDPGRCQNHSAPDMGVIPSSGHTRGPKVGPFPPGAPRARIPCTGLGEACPCGVSPGHRSASLVLDFGHAMLWLL